MIKVQCKKCANLKDDWCKMVSDSPDEELVRDCRYYRTLTNADAIRQIDADELLKHKGDAYDSEGHLLYAVGTGSIIAAPTIIEAEEG